VAPKPVGESGAEPAPRREIVFPGRHLETGHSGIPLADLPDERPRRGDDAELIGETGWSRPCRTPAERPRAQEARAARRPP
jgi:hypothetical protein